MIIYKIINKVNNKIYIGKDLNNNPKYFGSGKLLKLAIKKYGKENFEKIILEHCSSGKELCEKEIYWIKKLNSTNRNIGYNITFGGAGGDTFTNNPNKNAIIEKLRIKASGKTHSIETKNKISKLRTGKQNGMFGKVPHNLGKKTSDIIKEKISKANKGKGANIPRPDHVKEKISNSHKGKIKTDKHKENISKSLTGKKFSQETREKMSNSRKNKKQSLLTCPFCGKVGGTTMYRWHFDRCKHKTGNSGKV